MKKMEFPEATAGLTQLTPLQLNQYRFSGNHSVYTPAEIEEGD